MMTENPQPLLVQRRKEKRAFSNGVGTHGRRLIISAVGVGLLLVAFFFWRAHDQAAADKKLCLKIDRGTVALIQFVEKQPAPPKGTKARRLRDEFLAGERLALCNPANLPTVKGH